jgi:hypothetical protein
MALAIVALVLPLSGCLEDEGGYEGPFTILLAQPFMEARSEVGGNVWDATLDLNKITPPTEELRWTSLNILIKDPAGSVLLQETPLSKDSGLYGSAVEVWYVDEAGGRQTADTGDAFKITSMDQTYQGGVVQVMYRGKQAASVSLPIVFT